MYNKHMERLIVYLRAHTCMYLSKWDSDDQTTRSDENTLPRYRSPLHTDALNRRR